MLVEHRKLDHDQQTDSEIERKDLPVQAFDVEVQPKNYRYGNNVDPAHPASWVKDKSARRADDDEGDEAVFIPLHGLRI